MFYFYCSDGTKFDSKIDAVEYSINKKVQLHFYYYDSIYEKLDWTTEPPHSLDHYYLEKAKKIRDEYDYVILCYSGGYDSTNILETFYYNNLKIDKIVTVGAFDQDYLNFSDENHNGEIYHNAIPYLKELGLEHLLHKIDYSKLFDDTKNFSILNQKESWVNLSGSWFSPHNWLWYDIEKYAIPPEQKNKKVCILFGKDKPTLYEKNKNIHGFYFRDTPITSYASTFFKRTQYDNIKRIDFYWDPESPEILLKQLHILYRYYMIVKKTSYDSAIGAQTFGDKTVNSLIYNLRKPILFKSPKSPTTYLSLRDNFLKQKNNSEIGTFYKKGIREILSRTKNKQLMTVNSKFYGLVKQNV